MAQTSTSVTKTPTKYSFSQLEDLWIKNSGEGYKWLAPIMAAIALAESGGDPNATHRNSDGSIDRGLWQINSSHNYGTKSMNPTENAKEAVGVYHSQGLTAWSTFTNGAYLKFLPRNYNKNAVNTYLKQHPTGGGTAGATEGIGHFVKDPVGTSVNAAEQPLKDAGSAIADTIQLGLKEGMYAFAILGGGMLILLGLLFIGVDVGLSAFGSRASNHPAVRIAKRVSPRGGGSAGPVVEDTSSSTLPGPEA